MKKLFLILLTLLYTSAISGATFHLHFCGDHLQIISFAGMGHNECCCGKPEKKAENCCADKLVTIKVKDQHDQNSDQAVPVCSVKDISGISLFANTFQIITTETHLANVHPPPEVISAYSSLVILNCVFRI